MRRPVTLVLLPGLDGTDIFFQPLLRELPAEITPLVLTFPVTGDQGYPSLLRLVRESTGGLEEFHVLGWSFSGPLAVMLAASEPRRVRGVILSASFLRAPRRLLRPARFTLVGPVLWAWRVLRRAPLHLFRAREDPFRVAKRLTWSRVPAGVLARRLRAVAMVDVRSTLGACQMPLLNLVAGGDWIVPGGNADEIAAAYPAVRTKVLPGGHLAMYHHPRLAAAAIEALIGTSSDRG